jgi:hypothetical protein
MGSIPQNASAPRPGTLDERRALLQRALWSRQIEKSARIREFLAYVCERTFDEPGVEIHEQEIGHRVFGRPADYDTAADNAVRVTASQARKKLEQYFSSDGTAEPVILEIPKGQYTPVFRSRVPESEPIAILPPPVGELPRPNAMLAMAWCTPVLAVLSIWFGLKWRAERIAARPAMDRSPALHALWPRLLSQGHADIVVADSSLSLFQELLERQLTLSEYLNPGLWASADALQSQPKFQEFAQHAAQRRFTSIGSVTAAYRIAQLAGRDPSNISIFSARDFNIRQMKFDNVVLLGSVRANPWMELIQERLNFRFAYDQKSRRPYFENRHPSGNEPKEYRTDSLSSYCQIAFVPNLDKTGDVLAIAGTEVEGTEGGGEFVTKEESLAELTSKLQAGPDGRLPYFELLLASKRVGGVTPKFTIAAFRLIRP